MNDGEAADAARDLCTVSSNEGKEALVWLQVRVQHTGHRVELAASRRQGAWVLGQEAGVRGTEQAPGFVNNVYDGRVHDFATLSKPGDNSMN